MSRTISDSQSREYLADILDSPGWLAFYRYIATVLIKTRRLDALNHIRQGDIAKAQSALAAADAVNELLEGAYEGAGAQVPEEVRALRQPSFS